MHRLAVVFLMLLPACGATGGTPTPGPLGDPTGSWQLVAGMSDGAELPIPPDHPITLIFEPSRMGGTSACNRYGAEFSLTGAGIDMGQVGQTLRGCEDALAAAEKAYLSALLRVTGVGMHDEDLVLTGPGIEMRFERLPDPPTADLVEAAWTLEALFNGNVASEPAGESATLELGSDGTFSGSTGCRTFQGKWVELGNEIRVTAMDMNEETCPAELAGQDSHVVSVIGDGFVPSIDGDRLTLSDPGGMGLVYRSSEE